MTLVPRDRFERLRAQTRWNGIDYVEAALVTSAGRVRTELHIHFINPVPPMRGRVTAVTVARNGAGAPLPVPLKGARWGLDAEARPILRIPVIPPAHSDPYTLTLKSAFLDPYFDHATFSFTASYPSGVDCASPALVCPPPPEEPPHIDYLAKDFLSFRQALSDFSALRYPDWQERSEADFGVMFMEALCSVADDLSYTQDRIAAEAYLETATQRRSIVRHARLLDYEPRPHTASRVWLQFDVTAGPIPAGLMVMAHGPDGVPIPFETGAGLMDEADYDASPVWNRGEITPYFWDPSQACLKAGATSMWVRRHGFQFKAGQPLLIETASQSTADPAMRELVTLIAAVETTDPLSGESTPTKVTFITWRADDALKSDHDLTRTHLAGNLVPATQGRRQMEQFIIGGAPDRPIGAPAITGAAANTPVMTAPAIWRSGPDGSDQYLYTLRDLPLAWLMREDPAALPLPEIRLAQNARVGPQSWKWVRRLLDSLDFERTFTLDPARFRALPGGDAGKEVLWEYDDDAGDTIRFGDGVFGETPDAGTVFTVNYRVGGGAAGNVTPDSITSVDPARSANVLAVTNPWAAAGGADQESAERVRRLAPQAFRSKKLRAVRAEDYQTAAEALPWARRAGAQIRWTGSWHSAFTTVEPKGADYAPESRTIELAELLDRFRLAGCPSYVLQPRYVSLGLIITVQTRDNAFRSDVKASVISALSAMPTNGSAGFFDPDHFPPGTPLDRAALSGAIQNAFGVDAILGIQVRRLDRSAGFQDLPNLLSVGKEELVRVYNDPGRPDRGYLQVFVEGGK